MVRSGSQVTGLPFNVKETGFADGWAWPFFPFEDFPFKAFPFRAGFISRTVFSGIARFPYSTSLGKYFKTVKTGFGAAWPKPQMDASIMACESS